MELGTHKNISTLLGEIQHESRERLLVYSLIFLWAILGSAFFCSERYVIRILLVGTLCVLACAVVEKVWQSHFATSLAYIACICLFVCSSLLVIDSCFGLYSLSIIPVIGFSLRGKAGGYVCAMLATVIIVGFSIVQEVSRAFVYLVGPIWVVWGVTMATSLIHEGLQTAASWAWHSYQQAQAKAVEAQERRAEQLRISRDLQQATFRLERVNESLLVARERADEARRMKAQFAANISHELRTPLNLIVGFGQMLLTAPEFYGSVSLSAEYRSDISTIYRNARHLLSLVDDVLDLSQIEAGTMAVQLEPTQLSDVAEEAVGATRNLLVSKDLYLHTYLSAAVPKVALDKARMRQVIINLLTNASRFTDRGGVTVRTWAEDEHVCASVADTGIGMSSETAARVFEPFFQADSSLSRKTHGAGLGLSISKEFVEMHGGTISVDSQPGEGSTFVVRLPLGSIDGEFGLLWTGHRSMGNQRKSYVLVLETEPAILNLLRRRLDGYEVVSATSYEGAARVAQQLRPVCIVTDSADDLSKLVQLQAELGEHAVPIIGCPMPSRRRAAVAWGVSSILTKPVSQGDVDQALSGMEHQTVLIADSDADMVRLLKRMVLRATDCMLLAAFSEPDLTRQILNNDVDVLIVDTHLLGPDESETLARLGAQRQALRIIVVSDQSFLDAVQTAQLRHFNILLPERLTPLGMARSLNEIVGLLAHT